MARLIKCSWEERASCSVLGSGLSLKSYRKGQYEIRIKIPEFVAKPTLSNALLYLLRLLWLSLRLSLMVSKDDLAGF